MKKFIKIFVLIISLHFLCGWTSNDTWDKIKNDYQSILNQRLSCTYIYNGNESNETFSKTVGVNKVKLRFTEIGVIISFNDSAGNFLFSNDTKKPNELIYTKANALTYHLNEFSLYNFMSNIEKVNGEYKCPSKLYFSVTYSDANIQNFFTYLRDSFDKTHTNYEFWEENVSEITNSCFLPESTSCKRYSIETNNKTIYIELGKRDTNESENYFVISYNNFKTGFVGKDDSLGTTIGSNTFIIAKDKITNKSVFDYINGTTYPNSFDIRYSVGGGGSSTNYTYYIYPMRASYDNGTENGGSTEILNDCHYEYAISCRLFTKTINSKTLYIELGKTDAENYIAFSYYSNFSSKVVSEVKLNNNSIALSDLNGNTIYIVKDDNNKLYFDYVNCNENCTYPNIEIEYGCIEDLYYYYIFTEGQTYKKHNYGGWYPNNCINGLPEINTDMDIEELVNCNSLLGNPQINGSPAFYLQKILDIMKYVAIVLVIVLSVKDFLESITAKDEDNIKKALHKLIIRFIICIAIFVLPTILKFVFTLVDLYDPSICGIK